MKVHTIEIEKPLKEVYRAFNDPSNLPRWIQGLQRTEPISGTPGEVGSVSKQIYLERGRTIEMIETITDREPGRSFAGTLETPGMNATMRVEFQDRGAKTILRFSGDFEPCSLMMRVMLPFMKGAISKRQVGDLNKFKQLVEAGEL